MRIIDEKGRLFSKVNLLDFLVLVFILCLIPVGYQAYKIITKPFPQAIPTITLDKAEYEKEKAEYERLKTKRDNFLREHKRARKYF